MDQRKGKKTDETKARSSSKKAKEAKEADNKAKDAKNRAKIKTEGVQDVSELFLTHPGGDFRTPSQSRDGDRPFGRVLDQALH